ncbi:methylene-fatty-acyl-phospholipid synthase, putative [Coccidioides posadasii C735 delta SOWgp]|uniref:Phosphatidyl-N-methylethanolamine N-methyltransferase n=1 Tax=Coccidioides posadasii (strain C735) TaxID=222929 RepID=C5P624_COCP7|nr:methylene-fatty-acyl-phospholipid synthase, putative [Coccidioides posadasii C735 delta SOWgp]EER28164.1 methylene-fatty-acyl-phospholipid synthase, putative [Coccidioides posadasii C735 delta SOWgp]|eukprot:XP_003070309.1 methylene-fatty-acyl-phospholipid synthase, putative [Coccidioides posadasii C735 delta SOWgp]
MPSLTDFVDFNQPSFKVAAAAIAFNPIFWNVVARQEYRNHFLTRIFGSPYYGCYFLAVVIFSLGIFRDNLYNEALKDQPYFAPVHQPYVAYGLFAVGNTLVVSSMWALGLTGTYLGDYFGILMDAPVTGFPFNVSGAPMYWGSTMSFLAVALYYGKVAGLVLTAEVFIVYWLALKWEDPFTAEIYAKRNRDRAKSGKNSKRA